MQLDLVSNASKYRFSTEYFAICPLNPLCSDDVSIVVMRAAGSRGDPLPQSYQEGEDDLNCSQQVISYFHDKNSIHKNTLHQTPNNHLHINIQDISPCSYIYGRTNFTFWLNKQAICLTLERS